MTLFIYFFFFGKGGGGGGFALAFFFFFGSRARGIPCPNLPQRQLDGLRQLDKPTYSVRVKVPRMFCMHIFKITFCIRRANLTLAGAPHVHVRIRITRQNNCNLNYKLIGHSFLMQTSHFTQMPQLVGQSFACIFQVTFFFPP